MGSGAADGGIAADVERIAVDGRAVDTIFIDPARGGGGKRDGSGVVVRAAVREGGRGVGGGAVGEGQGVSAGCGDRHANSIIFYGNIFRCRVVVAVGDGATSSLRNSTAYRSLAI